MKTVLDLMSEHALQALNQQLIREEMLWKPTTPEDGDRGTLIPTKVYSTAFHSGEILTFKVPVEDKGPTFLKIVANGGFTSLVTAVLWNDRDLWVMGREVDLTCDAAKRLFEIMGHLRSRSTFDKGNGFRGPIVSILDANYSWP